MLGWGPAVRHAFASGSEPFSIWIEFLSSCKPYLLQQKLIDPWGPALKKVYVFTVWKAEWSGAFWLYGARDSPLEGPASILPSYAEHSFSRRGILERGSGELVTLESSEGKQSTDFSLARRLD